MIGYYCIIKVYETFNALGVAVLNVGFWQRVRFEAVACISTLPTLQACWEG